MNAIETRLTYHLRSSPGEFSAFRGLGNICYALTKLSIYQTYGFAELS